MRGAGGRRSEPPQAEEGARPRRNRHRMHLRDTHHPRPSRPHTLAGFVLQAHAFPRIDDSRAHESAVAPFHDRPSDRRARA